jgi:hypothetical protein
LGTLISESGNADMLRYLANQIRLQPAYRIIELRHTFNHVRFLGKVSISGTWLGRR